MEDLRRILLEHRLFAGLDPAFAEIVVGCARNVRFEAGHYLFRGGADADELYLVRHGAVALEVRAPGRGPVTFLSVGPGEVVGLSWLVPPYRWSFDARATAMVRAIALNARCLRDKCEADHELGYELMKRFSGVLLERLQATRFQILDVYGQAG